MKAKSDRIPKRIAGYKIIRQVGGGGMGIVYLARSKRGQMVALKVIRPEHSDSEEFRRRFGREAESASAVQGTCVARVVDCDTSGRQAYIASEFINGPTLEEYVQRHGPLQGDVLRGFALALAEALGAIHRAGIVHRDLKPSNVLLTADGPKVIDFGIARPADASAITSTGAALGTPSWMAPEQARGEKATEAADVFAWGALVAYAATGIPPFGQGSADAMLYRVVHEEPSLDGVSDALRSLVAGALEKNPGTRPSVAALASQLLDDETIVGVDQTVSARVADTLALTWQVPDSFEGQALRRRRLLIPALAVLSAAGLVAAAVLVWSLSRHDGDQARGVAIADESQPDAANAVAESRSESGQGSLSPGCETFNDPPENLQWDPEQAARCVLEAWKDGDTSLAYTAKRMTAQAAHTLGSSRAVADNFGLAGCLDDPEGSWDVRCELRSERGLVAMFGDANEAGNLVIAKVDVHRIPKIPATPEIAAKQLYRAWVAGDRLWALHVANEDAVNQLFLSLPSRPMVFNGCSEGIGSRDYAWMGACFFGTEYGDLQMGVRPGAGDGYMVDSAEFFGV